MEADILENFTIKMDPVILEDFKNKDMVSSIASASSSLTSPVDSGVQMLDSESDLTSVMSASGYELEKDPDLPISELTKLNEMFNTLSAKIIEETHVMTKSDIANQNINGVNGVAETGNNRDLKVEDVMNVSLNSYELLDYTIANVKNVLKEEDQMHVSMSEEVNETLQVLKATTDIPPIEPNVNEVKPIDIIPDEQIVFRRQRKKKSKSDTPKKRVSFHEDILNSTKIDDIHINHGFVTIEPDASTNFFLRGFTKKPDVVIGRYSWAAEGDAPFYDKNRTSRDVKSDIYVQRIPSISSSSSGSISSSSIDEEDKEDDVFVKKEPVLKMPISSCLKKTKHRKTIDTNIVEEEAKSARKKSETNLLDTNIFGSLKNILNFSSSVPLAERGVPEGQEDVTVYSSSSHDVSNVTKCNFNNLESQPKKAINLKLDFAKNNFKLNLNGDCTPKIVKNENFPANIVVCDSNVYEHKGISYSYEYDTFQKSFTQQKPKSSTVYQMILKEFNFFKRKAKQEAEKDLEEDFEILNALTPIKKPEEVETIEKYVTKTTMDWSDTETMTSDFTDVQSRHLHSPKKKINKSNHYAVQDFRRNSSPEFEAQTSKSLPNLRNSSSAKSSLINRFLRNVTAKKMLDLRLQKKLKISRKFTELCIRGARANKDASKRLDREIEEEILAYKKDRWSRFDPVLVSAFKKSVFRNGNENLVGVFNVSSAYTTSGEHKPLLVILTNSTIYITGFKATNTYCNHFVLPFCELNTVLIGPNCQTIHLSNYDKDMQCVITTGCNNITNDLIIQLEISMRKDLNQPKLPAIKQINMRDMVNLRKALCKQTPVDKDEEYYYYSIVNLQECNDDNIETPLGPNKEGPLMFKISETECRWETAYFILKAGVLYMLSSPSHRVPMRVLPLINGACQGARRVYNCPRPHTFQLIVSGSTLHLAAPDEYVASEWLQALVHAASGVYTQKEKNVAQACTLLMTINHILTVREAFSCNIIPTRAGHDPIKGAQALSCASISDITAFRLPSEEQSWCILEFACREVHESSGDWILYFASNSELENFISTLEMLWAYHNEVDCFPISTLPDSDQLDKRCSDTYMAIQNSWPTVSTVV